MRVENNTSVAFLRALRSDNLPGIVAGASVHRLAALSSPGLAVEAMDSNNLDFAVRTVGCYSRRSSHSWLLATGQSESHRDGGEAGSEYSCSGLHGLPGA